MDVKPFILKLERAFLHSLTKSQKDEVESILSDYRHCIEIECREREPNAVPDHE